MPDAPLSCPFCNAAVPAPDVAPLSGRVRCPRCGDLFPVPAAGAHTGPSAPQIADEVRRHRQARETRATRSLKVTLLVGLGLGVLGVVVGVSLRHLWQEPAHQPAAKVESAKPVAPLEMPGLAYLPRGTDSVIALQLRPLLGAFGGEQQDNPRAALAKLGLPDESLGGIERIAGLTLDNIDQLVFGLQLNGGVFARQLVLVVHSRTRYSIDETARRAKAVVEKKGERTYYRVVPGQFPDKVYWWAPNDRVLVAALEMSSLDGIPDEGRQAQDNLSPQLVKCTTALLTASTYGWAVLDSDRWELIAPLLLMAGKRGDLVDQVAEPLSSLRTITLGLNGEGAPALTGWFDLKSEKAATDWRTWLQMKYANTSGKIAVGGAGDRVMVRTAASREGIAAALDLGLPEKKKVP